MFAIAKLKLELLSIYHATQGYSGKDRSGKGGGGRRRLGEGNH